MLRAMAVLLLLAASAQADWPHLRGPHYSGVSDENGLAPAWPAGGPPVLWRVPMGQGYSGFAAAGGRLYTMAQWRSGQYALCLDADSGREVWRRRIEWPWKPDEDWPGPRATPTVSNGRVYVAGAFGLVACLDASSGREVWSVDLARRFEGVGTEFGYSCSPLVVDGKVILPVGAPGASVIALDARDGSVAWAAGDEAASYSSPLLVTVGGKKQFVVFLRNVLAGLDPDTGRMLWQDRWSEGYDEHSSWPIYEEPYLLACAAFRQGCRCLRLEADNGARATLAWKSAELSNDVLSSVAVRGHVYGFDLQEMQPRGDKPAPGRFKCIELATGRVRWSTDRAGHATVIAADGKLILLSESGELILARETPERYEELSRARILFGGHCWTPPTLHHGRLYARNHEEAVCVWLGSPEAAPPAQALTLSRHEDRRTLWCGPSLVAPDAKDLAWWYLACLLVLAVSLPAAAVVRATGVFCGAVFLLGVSGTFVISRAAGTFVFTWPVALFAGYRLAFDAAQPSAESRRLVSYLAAAAFVAMCVGYYWACRQLFVPAGIGFLVGFFAAAMLDAFVPRRPRRMVETALWSVVSFTVYFWTSGLFTVWRTRL